jgi:hypothetical protein
MVSFENVSTVTAVALGLIFAIAIASTLLLAQLLPSKALRGMVGLLAGHTLILVAAVIFYAILPPVSLIPFFLDLTRTSPIWLVLCVVLSAASVEVIVECRDSVDAHFLRLLALAILLTLGLTYVVLVRWFVGVLLAMLTGLIGWGLAVTLKRQRLSATLYCISGITALLYSAVYDNREAELEPQVAELFGWARQTERDALFIIPLSFQEFRYYARRSVYVDFKCFEVLPARTQLWRKRLEKVALPDSQGLEACGWPAMEYWDRTYANRNTPSRIADLLEATGADYFVWDAAALKIPPYTRVLRSSDAQVSTAFKNDRFVVYTVQTEKTIAGGVRDL